MSAVCEGTAQRQRTVTDKSAPRPPSTRSFLELVTPKIHYTCFPVDGEVGNLMRTWLLLG